MAHQYLMIICVLDSDLIMRTNQMTPKREFQALPGSNAGFELSNVLHPRYADLGCNRYIFNCNQGYYQMKPRIGCIVVCLALILAVLLLLQKISRLLFALLPMTRHRKSFAGILLCSWDQGTVTCIRAEGLLCM